MTQGHFFALAVFVMGCTQAPVLTRQDRQDTIYELRGDPTALADFQRRVGMAWTGGMIIDADPSDGALSYWAFGDRTAAEARALMMPAIMSGLELRPKEYSEAEAFPADRRKLDEIALKCGSATDPFFLTPKRTVEISLPEGDQGNLGTCLSAGIRDTSGLTITNPRKAVAKK